MKKIILLFFISLLQFVSANGQTMSKQKAQQFLQKAWNDLKASDSISFADLWLYDNSPRAYQKGTFTKQDAIDNFNFMREYLDTALNRNLAIDHVEIEKYTLKNTDTKHWIRAWFKYDDHYYKGFGFYLAYKNEGWVVRDSPTTSSMSKD